MMKSKGKKTEKLDKKKPSVSKKDAATTTNDLPQVLAVSQPVAEPVALAVAVETPEPVALPTATSTERRVISNDERRRLISLAAYYRAQKAGFGKTNPVEDWLMAEREIDALMTSGDAT